jgi:hypothetical protein
MRVFNEIYDFIAGRSIAAPVGVVVALSVAHFAGTALPPATRAAAFLGTLLLTFFASTLEPAR